MAFAIDMPVPGWYLVMLLDQDSRLDRSDPQLCVQLPKQHKIPSQSN